MPELAPFKGIRYDADAVGDIGAVVAPPYDVIGPDARDRLEEASPYNVVRLTLPRDEAANDRYTRARALLETWHAAGVLRRDEQPLLYVYEIRAAGRATRGVLGGLGLGEAGVLPHERTYDDIVADRLDLLRATAVNLEPIFAVYEGDDTAAAEAVDAAASGEPLVRFVAPDRGEHLLWAIADPAAIDAIARSVEKAVVVIADGHHRWKTAQRYAAERRAAEGAGPWDLQLAWIVDTARSGPELRAIHRVVEQFGADRVLEQIEPAFDVEPASGTPEELVAGLAERRARGRIFALLEGPRAWWLTPRDPAAERDAMPADRSAAWRDLDVAVLHEWVFGRLLGGVTPRFVHEAAEAAAEASASGGVAFLVPPTPFDAVRAVAEAGDAMPQKSTYFVPKPRTGLVMRPLD